MKEKAWGIFCNKNEVEAMTKRLEKAGRDIFEVRPLSTVEKFTYAMHPLLCVGEPYIIMFHATTLQYKWFLFKNKLSKAF